MELSSCLVFISVILNTVNSAKALAMTNSSSKTELFQNSWDIIYGTGSSTTKIKECFCGSLSVGCHFVNGQKICDCKKGAAQNGEKCEPCDCGAFGSKCYFENGQQMCNCQFNTAVYTYGKFKKCKFCECGYKSIKCEFEGTTKVCTCPVLYIQKNGKCEECDCGYNSITCSFTYTEVRKCKCEPGYISKPRNSYSDDEYCIVYSNTSSWRIATYVMGAILSLIIIGLVIFIVGKKATI